MYDTIIIGAGPAGSTAAKTLSKNNKKVLLVEKFALPRYKSCSGQLIKKSIDLVKKYFGEDVPLSVTCDPSENNGTILFDENGNESCYEQSALNVWRSDFDFWLTKKAVASGTGLRDNTIALLIEENEDFVTVTLKEKGKSACTENAKYVIISEGVAGNIAKKITTENKKLVTTFQTFNEGKINLDPHFFHAFLQKDFSEYDAWFNVKDNMLVVGVAVKNPEKIHFYYEKFINYLKQNHGLEIKKEIRSEKWPLPLIEKDFKINHGKDRVFITGEASGFLNPMGEGISSAIESGHLAATSILENFNRPELALKYYEESTKELEDYMRRQWRLVGLC